MLRVSDVSVTEYPPVPHADAGGYGNDQRISLDALPRPRLDLPAVLCGRQGLGTERMAACSRRSMKAQGQSASVCPPKVCVAASPKSRTLALTIRISAG